MKKVGLAERTHFFDELFEAAMVGDGLVEGFSLRLGKSHGDGFGFDLARPAPGAGVIFGDTALA